MNFQRGPQNRRKKNQDIICRCHEVDRQTIEKAIATQGAKTANEIFDLTTAGVGPCGGSCRGKIQCLLDEYLRTGQFPKDLRDIYKGCKS